MVLQIGEEKWKVHFSTHDLTEKELADLRLRQKAAGHPNRLWDVDVTCHLHSGPCIESVLHPKHCVNGRVGVAHCSLKDSFDRREGHKKALGRALEGLPYDTRKLIWDAYWLKCRRPKEASWHFQARIAGTAPSPAA